MSRERIIAPRRQRGFGSRAQRRGSGAHYAAFLTRPSASSAACTDGRAAMRAMKACRLANFDRSSPTCFCPVGHREQVSIRHREAVAHQVLLAGEL